MNIIEATELMKAGKRVTRQSWGNPALHLFLLVGSTTHQKHINQGVKPVFDHAIKARTGRGRAENWTPNHADVTATDWEIAE